MDLFKLLHSYVKSVLSHYNCSDCWETSTWEMQQTRNISIWSMSKWNVGIIIIIIILIFEQKNKKNNLWFVFGKAMENCLYEGIELTDTCRDYFQNEINVFFNLTMIFIIIFIIIIILTWWWSRSLVSKVTNKVLLGRENKWLLGMSGPRQCWIRVKWYKYIILYQIQGGFF